MIKGLSREALVFGALLTLTTLNWAIFETTVFSGSINPKFLGAILLFLAFLKSWLVIDNFMEARECPPALRGILAAWTIIVAGSLLVHLLLF